MNGIDRSTVVIDFMDSYLEFTAWGKAHVNRLPLDRRIEQYQCDVNAWMMYQLEFKLTVKSADWLLIDYRKELQ